MSDLPTQFILSLELLMVLAGCILLWRHALSPVARVTARDRAATMPAWDIPVTRFLFFIWLIISGGLLLPAITMPILKSFALDESTALIINGGTFQGGMLLGILLFKLFFDSTSTDNGQQRSGGRIIQNGLMTLLIALPVLAAVGITWQFLLGCFGIELQDQDLIAIFAKTSSPWLLSFMILLAAGIAPITEELIFRAGIFRFLRTRVPRWIALLGPALLFASLHANLASFAPLAALGIIFSLAYERTGSIAVPIIAHGLFNLNTIVLILSGVGL
jgi:uncharacterized protein